MQTANSVQLLIIMLSQRRNLKKAAIFMISISLFSFFPFLLPLFFQFCASSLFFNYSSERHYMFLFCNGILAFVIKDSILSANTHMGISSNHPIITSHEEITKKKNEVFEEYQKPESVHGEEEEVEVENEFLIAEEREEEYPIEENDDEEYQKPESVHEEEEVELEVENEFLIAEEREEDDDDEEYQKPESVHGEEEEEYPVEEDEDEEDELNKKCEEFIRRMKQGIKIEADQEMGFDHNRSKNYLFN
ncbi:glutamic acid-rich protein-like isoform X1 [Impatiens glandulifera]|uniref:glutamic acid-rich protein-like isoform X1 n=1 Tax=Impatiens glandulifera TaxID=253017 RepID=UPI001FB125EC|nr:glutamic acid-rich protein-like isoform X1 [Impatiens glandulifera]